jgi:hypothetical protein
MGERTFVWDPGLEGVYGASGGPLDRQAKGSGRVGIGQALLPLDGRDPYSERGLQPAVEMVDPEPERAQARPWASAATYRFRSWLGVISRMVVSPTRTSSCELQVLRALAVGGGSSGARSASASWPSAHHRAADP